MKTYCPYCECEVYFYIGEDHINTNCEHIDYVSEAGESSEDDEGETNALVYFKQQHCITAPYSKDDSYEHFERVKADFAAGRCEPTQLIEALVNIKFASLSPEQQEEVSNFTDFLLQSAKFALQLKEEKEKEAI